MSSSQQLVSFEQQGAIGHIVLDNPPENRINREFYAQLGRSARQALRAGCRAVLIRSAGPDFSLGGDFTEWPSFGTHAAKKERFSFSNGILQMIESLPMPTISAVNGRAFGGGFELALHTDIIVAGAAASFRFPEVTLGVSPLAGGAQRVAERAGRAVATRMVMLSELMTAEEAYRTGIVARVVPDAELQAKAEAMAEQLSKGPTRAHEATKLVISTWSTSGVRAADEVMIGAVVDLLDTRDCRAGVDAAIEAHAAGRPRPDTGFTGE